MNNLPAKCRQVIFILCHSKGDGYNIPLSISFR